MSLFLIDLSLMAIRRDISMDQKCQILGGDVIKSKNLILCTPVCQGSTNRFADASTRCDSLKKLIELEHAKL
jgi:hypothetical protein